MHLACHAFANKLKNVDCLLKILMSQRTSIDAFFSIAEGYAGVVVDSDEVAEEKG